MDSGSDLSSRAVSSQVPSALRGLTSVFGMGTGGTPSSLPPEIVNFLNGLEAVSGSFTPLRPFPLHFFLSASALLLRPFRPALACRSSRPVLRSPSGFPFCFSSPLSAFASFGSFPLPIFPSVSLSSAVVVCLHALALLFPVSAGSQGFLTGFAFLPFRLLFPSASSHRSLLSLPSVPFGFRSLPAPFRFFPSLSAFASCALFPLPVGSLFPGRFVSSASLVSGLLSSVSASALRLPLPLWCFLLPVPCVPFRPLPFSLPFRRFRLYPDNCTSNDSLTDLSIDLFSWILRSN